MHDLKIFTGYQLILMHIRLQLCTVYVLLLLYMFKKVFSTFLEVLQRKIKVAVDLHVMHHFHTSHSWSVSAK